MNRRKFLSLSGAFLMLGSVASTVSCITKGIYQQILQYVGLGLQAFQSILDILAGAGVVNPLTAGGIDALIALVKAAFADLQTAVNQYDSAPADQKNSFVQKISTALAILQNRLGEFWTNLKIPDQKLALTIQGLIGVIISTIMGFATQLPQPATAPKAPPAGIKATPKRLTPSQFKEEFNSILDANGLSQHRIR